MKMIRSLICIKIIRKTDVRFIYISKEATTLIFVKEFFSPWLKAPKSFPVILLFFLYFLLLVQKSKRKLFQTQELTGK